MLVNIGLNISNGINKSDIIAQKLIITCILHNSRFQLIRKYGWLIQPNLPIIEFDNLSSITNSHVYYKFGNCIER